MPPVIGEEVVMQKTRIYFRRVRTYQCHPSTKATSKSFRNNRITVQRRLIREDNISWSRLYAPSPCREVVLCNMANVGEIESPIILTFLMPRNTGPLSDGFGVACGPS
jgi:hypothetical protein